MSRAVEFLKNIFKSQKFYLVSGIASSVCSIPASFLFVRGVKDAIANAKHKNWRGFIRGVLEMIPMVACVTGTILSLMIGHRIAMGQMNTALESISRLSNVISGAGVVAGTKAEEVVDKITDNIADKVNEKKEEIETPAPKNEDKVIEMVDGLSGQKFQSSIFKVNQAVNDFNARLISSMDQMTVNDWYYYLGLEQTEIGDKLYFEIDENGNGQLRVTFTPKMINGVPVTYICYRVHCSNECTRLC